MESGPSRVNAPLGGPVIPRSRRDLFKDQSFVEGVTMQASIHPIQSEHAKVGSWEGGREGTQELV